MFCIECKQECERPDRKILCKFCGKKLDKYTQANDALKFLDCLLLKDQAFRHIILNQRVTLGSFARVLAWQMASHIILSWINLRVTTIQLEKSEINFRMESAVFQMLSQLFHALLLVAVFHRHPPVKLLFAIYASSFFNLFKIVFALWQYREVQFYVTLEVLNCCANICALKCFGEDPRKIVLAVLMAKVASYGALLALDDMRIFR